MSDATLTTFYNPLATSSHRSELANAVRDAVSRCAHGKEPQQLDKGELTVRLQTAETGSLSDYRHELWVTMDYADYPFDPDQFNTQVAHNACTRLADDIWNELKHRADKYFSGPLLVWVIAGHMTGYCDHHKAAT